MKTCRQAFAAIMTLVLAFGLSATARADDELRVGKAMSQAFSFVPLDIGIKEGFFKKRGLAIESVSFAGSAKLQQALAAGGIDFGLGSGPELAFIAKGTPVQGIAAMAGEPLLLVMIVRSDTGIASVADLKGKRISVSTVGSLTSWLVRELSQKQGWGPDGITVRELGSTGSQVAAMKTKQIDGMMIDIATALTLQEAGDAKILVKFGELEKDFIIHVIFANRAIMTKNPDVVRRFLDGWFETIAFMRKNKAETVAISTEVMGVTPAVAAQTYDEVMPMFSDDGKFDAKALAVLQRSFVEMGILPTEPDMSKLYTEQFLPGAAH
ncbi:MAG: sulfonate transporter, periplasmic sulfonate-binding protein [Rhodospirillales bacterium]|jgi:NitT/TauT family transport system substrate-binding protein|nr:sulfonate transporter, periplasmic sulfonate-binding protein [Rhodospirillales bacterium]